MNKKVWESLFGPKDKFSIAHFNALHQTLLRNENISDSNKDLLIETIRELAELITWGDQNDSAMIDFFLEKNILMNFLRILQQRAPKAVKIQVFQTLTILIQNLTNQEAINYILSNNHINEMINHRFDFSDEELMAYYITFLKTLSFRLNPGSIHLFFDERKFPLYTNAILFFNHEEHMVRVAVRTLTLNVFKVEDHRVRKFIVETAVPYFSNLMWLIRDKCFSISVLLTPKMDEPINFSRIEAEREEQTDVLLYLNDVFGVNCPELAAILCGRLLYFLVKPVILNWIVPLKGKGQASAIKEPIAIVFLAEMFTIFNHPPLVDALSRLLLSRRQLSLDDVAPVPSRSKTKKPLTAVQKQLHAQRSLDMSTNGTWEPEEAPAVAGGGGGGPYAQIDEDDNDKPINPFRNELLAQLATGDDHIAYPVLLLLYAVMCNHAISPSFKEACGLLSQKMKRTRTLMDELTRTASSPSDTESSPKSNTISKDDDDQQHGDFKVENGTNETQETTEQGKVEEQEEIHVEQQEEKQEQEQKYPKEEKDNPQEEKDNPKEEKDNPQEEIAAEDPSVSEAEAGPSSDEPDAQKQGTDGTVGGRRDSDAATAGSDDTQQEIMEPLGDKVGSSMNIEHKSLKKVLNPMSPISPMLKNEDPEGDMEDGYSLSLVEALLSMLTRSVIGYSFRSTTTLLGCQLLIDTLSHQKTNVSCLCDAHFHRLCDLMAQSVAELRYFLAGPNVDLFVEVFEEETSKPLQLSHVDRLVSSLSSIVSNVNDASDKFPIQSRLPQYEVEKMRIQIEIWMCLLRTVRSMSHERNSSMVEVSIPKAVPIKSGELIEHAEDLVFLPCMTSVFSHRSENARRQKKHIVVTNKGWMAVVDAHPQQIHVAVVQQVIPLLRIEEVRIYQRDVKQLHVVVCAPAPKMRWSISGVRLGLGPKKQCFPGDEAISTDNTHTFVFDSDKTALVAKDMILEAKEAMLNERKAAVASLLDISWSSQVVSNT